MNFVDLGRVTLRDSERQVHTVALNRRHRSHHLRAVQATVDVLTLEFLLRTVRQCLVEWAAISQPHIAHGLGQGVFVELLGAGEVHFGNGGALFNDHHQHIAIGFQTDVFE